MARIVAGIGVSHAPGALGWPDAPKAEVKDRLSRAARVLGERLELAKPDIVIAFLDDHFENHFRNLMPTVSVGIADKHIGPAVQWLEALRLTQQDEYAGAPEFAEHLLRYLVGAGFDPARMGSIEYGNNFVVPWKMMAPAINPAVVPIYTNVFSPPVMPCQRAFEFGKAVRSAVLAADPELRVAFLATGGLSHWPPFWNESSPPEDTFLNRMKRFQQEGKTVLKDDPQLMTDLAAYEIEMAAANQWPLNSPHPLVNAEWDRKILKAVEKGDVQTLCSLTFEEVDRDGGHGGHEILNWIQLMGAMNAGPAEVVDYEPVIEWICGMAYVSYEV